MATKKKIAPKREQDSPLSVRVPAPLLARVDALVSRLAAHDAFALQSGVSRSDVIRLAMMRGVEQLEKEAKGAKA